MAFPQDVDFIRYLASKRSVEDRALNRRVLDSLLASLPTSTASEPLRVLEVGAGIGVMFRRLLVGGALAYADYIALDLEERCLAHASQELPSWAQGEGWEVEREGEGCYTFQREGRRIRLTLKTRDVFDFIQDSGQPAWDLLIAHAFLDLVDVPRTLPRLLSLLVPGGLFYFPITYDGLTLFEPSIDPTLDQQIIYLYHQSMDERLTDGNPSGDSRTGRHLFTHLSAAGAELIAAGASDWVVHPLSGAYPADETYFLHFIIHTVDQQLSGHPDLDPGRFADWVAQRHAQVERGELTYIAHQLDFLGRRSVG